MRGVVNDMNYTGKEVSTIINNNQAVDYSSLQTNFSNALLAVDDIVLKNYLPKIDTLNIMPLDE